MFSYTIIQWLFLFYFYCFFGWCFESFYVSLKKRKWVNRGFMKGPFLPLYGSGAVMMLVVSRPFLEHWWAVYIAGCIGATILEYVTGVVMEALFKVRYWDYSNQPLNFQGHICLGSSLAWGGLTLFMNYVIHKPVENLMRMLPANLLTIVTFLLTVYIVGDFTLSFKAALDLRDILVHTEKAKEDLRRIEKRLENLKESIVKKTAEYSQDIREQMLDLHAEYKLHVKSQERYESLKALSKRIHNNPTMSSVRYKEALEELKRKIEEKKKK